MWGVKVTTCLPSFHITPLLDGVRPKMQNLWDRLPPEIKEDYGSAGLESLKRCGEQLVTDWAWDAERVVEGLYSATTSTATPPAELVIGGDARFGLLLCRHLPPVLYEAIIYFYTMWDFVEPASPPQKQ